MKFCSENSCNDEAIKEIQIRGESQFSGRKYKMWVYVCEWHYLDEQHAKTILDETMLEKTLQTKGDST